MAIVIEFTPKTQNEKKEGELKSFPFVATESSNSIN